VPSSATVVTGQCERFPLPGARRAGTGRPRPASAVRASTELSAP